MMEVIPGTICINEIWQLHDLPAVKVWEVDLRSKYAEAIVEQNSNECNILLYAGENTLYDNKDAETDTLIRIPLSDEWCFVVETRKYSVRIVTYLRSNNIWSNGTTVYKNMENAS